MKYTFKDFLLFLIETPIGVSFLLTLGFVLFNVIGFQILEVEHYRDLNNDSNDYNYVYEDPTNHGVYNKHAPGIVERETILYNNKTVNKLLCKKKYTFNHLPSSVLHKTNFSYFRNK